MVNYSFTLTRTKPSKLTCSARVVSLSATLLKPQQEQCLVQLKSKTPCITGRSSSITVLVVYRLNIISCITWRIVWSDRLLPVSWTSEIVSSSIQVK